MVCGYGGLHLTGASANGSIANIDGFTTGLGKDVREAKFDGAHQGAFYAAVFPRKESTDDVIAIASELDRVGCRRIDRNGFTDVSGRDAGGEIERETRLGVGVAAKADLGVKRH